MTSAGNEPEEVEIHPQYEVAMHIDELFSIPVYRSPENPLIESWREIGERLLALGERHLQEGLDEATIYLEGKLEERRKRRDRRRARRRLARAPQPAVAPQAETVDAAAAPAAEAPTAPRASRR